MANILNPVLDDSFDCAGLVFLTESDKMKTSPEDPISAEFEIKSIDLIYDPSFDKVEQFYRIPVFFKAGDYSEYVDNGR